MWAALHLCDRKFFSSYWNFVKAYCIVEDTPFGKQIVGVRNIAAFRRVVAPYVIHRKKDLKDYPPKTRQAIDVEMEPWQKKLHDQLKNQLMAEIEDQNGSTTLIVAMNTLSAAIKLRQLLTCPKILDPSLGWGIGLETILEDMQESELSHYVLSTKWRSALPYLAEFFSTNGIRAEMLHGGLGPDEVDERINRWTKNGGLMMQTIDFAESYELAAAHVMYFLGADYDAERNSQAEDRINRDIRVTPHPSDYYYIRHVDSLEADLFDEMALAADMVHNLMNRPLSQVHTLFGG